MFVNKLFTYLIWAYLLKRFFNVKSSTCFHMKTKIMADFQICKLGSYRLLKSRSSHQRCSVTKGVLRNFVKFTGNQLCLILFFNKVAGLRTKACNSIKKESLTQMFSREFREISQSAFFHRASLVAASEKAHLPI